MSDNPSSRSWLDQLQPASWRGLPFAVKASEYRRGRRFAVHEYPFRDVPWAEDVGRASRVVGFSGFVVGDDCFAQAQALLAAAEVPGAGTLVHPSLGQLTVALIEPLVGAERAELGRVVELRFEFMETGTPLYPSDSTSTQSDVSDKAAAAQSASASDFNDTFTPSPNGGLSPNDVGGFGNPTTYTDSKGNVTSIPNSGSGIAYQADVGADTIGAWGNMAIQQAATPGAVSAAGLAPPAGTTFGRFDSSSTPTVQDTQMLLDAQVANQAAVNGAVTQAKATALDSALAYKAPGS